MVSIKRLCAVLLLLLLASCASVVRPDLMKEATRNPDLAVLGQSPDAYRNHLFALGGLVVQTAFRPEGWHIEAISAPVDSLGHVEEASALGPRCLAIYPNDMGVLDPLIDKGRTITVAGTLVGTTKGKAGEGEYVFPVFKVSQIHRGARYTQAFHLP